MLHEEELSITGFGVSLGADRDRRNTYTRSCRAKRKATLLPGRNVPRRMRRKVGPQPEELQGQKLQYAMLEGRHRFNSDGEADDRRGASRDVEGAGIVADSNPELEQQECVNKAKALFRAAEEARRFASSAKRGQ